MYSLQASIKLIAPANCLIVSRIAREAPAVFADALASTFPDPRHSEAEDRFVAFGFSHRQRLIAVLLTACL